MAKDIGSYFLEQGQPIVPKAKPKQYTIAKEKSQTEAVLDILNTKAAATMLSPRTYTNLVGQTARKAYDQQDISASDYYDIVMPLFGETGEMVTEKIRQYDAELDRYADGGRVNFGIGAGGTDPKTGQGFQIGNTGFRTKDGEVRNVKGKNQYSPLRTLEEVQKAIDDAPPITIKGKTFERNAKDLIADSFYVNKKKGGTQYITRREFDEYKNKLKFKATGPKNFGEETRKKARDKRRDFTKTRSSESLEKALAAPQKSKLNFHHAGFKESLTDLKNTMYIPGSSNRKMAKLFEDPLLKEMETFTKIFDDPKATTKQKQKAATDYLKNDRALRQKYPQFKNFKTRLSFRRTAFEPGIMFKEKLPDPSLAISNEPGMTLKGETSKSPRGKEIIKKATEKYGKYAKAIARPVFRAAAPFIPFVGTAGMVMGGADVAKASEFTQKPDELAAAYLFGPEGAKGLASLKNKVRGKSDEFEEFVP
jgi:hypothetical protein